MRNAILELRLPEKVAPSSTILALRDPLRRADWLLRITVVIFAAGLAIAIFTRNESSIGDIALMEWGLPPGQIFLWERIVVTLLFAGAVSLLFYPSSLVLIAIAGAVFAEAYAGYRSGGYAFAEYTPFAEALRYLTPLALIPLTWATVRFEPWRSTMAAWILRVGLATVFFMHGLEALWQHPGFIDLILGSARNLFGLGLSEAVAVKLLQVIGWADLAVALLLLIRPSRPLLSWLCFWALVTALSRPIGLGFGAYPEVLLRASHILAPAALWWLLFASKSGQPAENGQTKSSEGSTSDS